MKPEIKQNFEEKLRLVLEKLLLAMDDSIKHMVAEHSSRGLVKSGNTIKRTMDFISRENSNLYKEVLNHVSTLNPHYYEDLESDILRLTTDTQKTFKAHAFDRLKKSTQLVGIDGLFDKMIPELEKTMASQLANFQNDLNAIVIDTKSKSHTSPINNFLLYLEAILLLISMFLAGMWFKDPHGNYEPILVCLGLIIPLMEVCRRINAKNNLND